MANYYYLNGDIVTKEEAKISVGDIAIGRGYGIFDYFQLKNGAPIFMIEHLDRFLYSAKSLRLKIKEDRASIEQAIQNLIKINGVEFAGIKLIATGGISPDGFSIGASNLAIQVLPYFEPSPETIRNGVKLLSFEYQRLLPHIKSTNYLYNVYLSEQLKAAGAMEPLYYTKESVRETARANVFAVIDGTLITAADKVLKGINREKVLSLGLPFQLRNITLDELKQAEEVFLTGTTKRALGVVQIDDQVIGNGAPGPITMKVREMLLEEEQKQIDSHKD